MPSPEGPDGGCMVALLILSAAMYVVAFLLVTGR